MLARQDKERGDIAEGDDIAMTDADEEGNEQDGKESVENEEAEDHGEKEGKEDSEDEGSMATARDMMHFDPKSPPPLESGSRDDDIWLLDLMNQTTPTFPQAIKQLELSQQYRNVCLQHLVQLGKNLGLRARSKTTLIAALKTVYDGRVNSWELKTGRLTYRAEKS